MSKSLFDQLKEVNEEIKNIKKTTDNLKLFLNNSKLMDMSSPLEAIKLFIQQSVKSQGEIKKYISDLSQRIDGLNGKIDILSGKRKYEEKQFRKFRNCITSILPNKKKGITLLIRIKKPRVKKLQNPDHLFSLLIPHLLQTQKLNQIIPIIHLMRYTQLQKKKR